VNGAIGAGGFLAGCLLLALELGCAGAAARLLVVRRAVDLHGAPRLVALGLLTTVGMVAIQVVPLALGVLTRGTVAVAALVLLGAVSRVPAAPARAAGRAAAGRADDGEPAPLRWPALRSLDSASALLAGAGALLFAAFTLAYLELNSTFHPVAVDALSFHFPGVIRYIQSGSLWQNIQYLPGQAQGNYPQNGDVLMLAVTLAWHSLAMVRLLDPLLLALAAVGVYAIGRELGAPAPAAALSALALMAIRPTLGPAVTDVLTDPAFLAGFAAGTLFLLRHWRTGARSELLLAGAGLGLAFGTKWYGLTDVPALLLVWIAASLLAGRSRRALARDTGWLVLAVLLTGGIWLLRNLVLTGNPVFDYKVGLFGLTIFAAPPDPLLKTEGFTLWHYIPHPTILRYYVWPVFREDFGVTGGLVVAGGLITAALALGGRLRRRALPDVSRLSILMTGALLCAVAYALTPYSAQGYSGHPILVDANTRYGAPALVLGAPVLAWLTGRLGRWRILLEAVLLGSMWVDLHRYLVSSTGRIVLCAALVALVVAIGWELRRRSARADRRLGRVGLPALAAVLAVAVAVLSYHDQRVLARRPYIPADPVVAYVLAHAPAGTRIALTGQWTAQGLIPVAPLFGPRLENDVTYIGPWIRHRLQQYSRPRPFDAALRADHAPYLVVGTGFPPLPDPIEARWARADGYRVLGASSRLVLMVRASSG
jgi:hypothetical protein